MTLDLNAVHADYEAWQKAHQAFDTDEWHLTANKLAGWVPDLIAALAAVEQDRDRLRPLIGRLADQLEDLSKAQCWQGPRAFPGCDNGGCTHRRNLIAESRAAIAEHSGTEADSPHASK